jgi:hypothetical protein
MELVAADELQRVGSAAVLAVCEKSFDGPLAEHFDVLTGEQATRVRSEQEQSWELGRVLRRELERLECELVRCDTGPEGQGPVGALR